ncbi:MAG: hypothetical protein ACI4OI_01300, partial [Gemmiger sp.]
WCSVTAAASPSLPPVCIWNPAKNNTRREKPIPNIKNPRLLPPDLAQRPGISIGDNGSQKTVCNSITTIRREALDFVFRSLYTEAMERRQAHAD